MRDKPHEVKHCEISTKRRYKHRFCILKKTSISLCSAADSRTDQVHFYLLFNFHVQLTNGNVGSLSAEIANNSSSKTQKMANPQKFRVTWQLLPSPRPRGILSALAHSPKFQTLLLLRHRNFAYVKAPLFKPFQK